MRLFLGAILIPNLGLASPCVPLLTQAEITDLLREDRARRTDFLDRYFATSLENDPALQFVRVIETDHPDGPRMLYTLNDPNRPHSQYGNSARNPHGAHHYTALALGPRIARLLGVTQSENGVEVILPSPRRINAAIQRLNRYLPNDQQIHWTFYEGIGKTDSIAYLNQIIDSMGLPISTLIQIHDINYHLGSIAMPNAYSTHLRQHAQQMRAISLYLLQKRKQDSITNPRATPAQWLLNHFMERVITREANILDALNGNFTLHLSYEELNVWYKSFHSSKTSPRSPISHFRETANDFHFGDQSTALNQWLTTQLESYSSTHSLLAPLNLSLPDLQSLVLARRIALENAAIAVENEQP